MGGDINKCEILALFSKICQHSGDLPNSVKLYFPNNQNMEQNINKILHG